jgi:hypothetical protein
MKWKSEAYLEEMKKRTDLEVLEGPRPMSFDSQGNLSPLKVHGGGRKADL